MTTQPLLRIGCHLPAVADVQQRLTALALYRGPIDGIYGGGTAAAVKTFQRREGIGTDGQVGPQTWAKLFPAQELPANPLLQEPLAKRCLAMTAGFETGKGFPDCFAQVTGDFDGQGMSLGVLQWNFGQGSLQPLLSEALRAAPEALAEIFHEHLPVLEAMLAADREEQMAFARSLAGPRHGVVEPWLGMFKALCRLPAFQDIQVRHAARLIDEARRLAKQFGLGSERAVALMFDILTQNGGIGSVVAAQIRSDFAGVTESGEAGEVACMVIVAKRRAAAAKAEWAEDVRIRKLCIAQGRGRVHGIDYDLEAQYGLFARSAGA